MKRVSATTDFSRDKLECLELSPRELNIAKLIAWGWTQKEIAKAIHRSTFTVQTQLKHIYAQLHIHKESDLTRWYLFKEYHINDDPFKRVLAIFLLILCISIVLTENTMLRVFRGIAKPLVERSEKPTRARRYRNVFETPFALTA